ncbi:14168_t:CDS:2 [Ambispora leptoticha]|uniref:14168_t:CDS:1 n=1 Tax=Ambispora leptoticha TaxID=144679 RepID=A0A9N9CDJ2_9GLOM|nr:14168_t:CDS:2 [Ambispora leptoticha]
MSSQQPKILEKIFHHVLQMEGFTNLWILRRTCRIWNTTIVELVLQELRNDFSFELSISDQYNKSNTYSLEVEKLNQDGFFLFTNHGILLPDVAFCTLEIKNIEIQSSYIKHLFIDWKVKEIRLQQAFETSTILVSSNESDSKKGLEITLDPAELFIIIEEINEQVNIENENIIENNNIQEIFIL